MENQNLSLNALTLDLIDPFLLLDCKLNIDNSAKNSKYSKIVQNGHYFSPFFESTFNFVD